jgi:hypothetical protein
MTDRNAGTNRADLPSDATAIRDEQVDRALRRLEDCGGLTPHQRAVVEQLGARLTAGLLELFEADDIAVEDAAAGSAEREMSSYSD